MTDPTPAQIRAACRAIRRTWSREETRKRFLAGQSYERRFRLDLGYRRKPQHLGA